MNTFRFLHTSDWQLGMPANFLGEDARARFSEARLAAVEELFEQARQHECEAIIVAGDVFDDNLLRPDVYRRAMDVLRRSPVPIYLLPGNHDPYDAASIYHGEEFKKLKEGSPSGAPVEVLHDRTPRVLRRQRAGSAECEQRVEILGAPLKTKKPHEDLVARAIQECEDRDAQAEPMGTEQGSTPLHAHNSRIRVLVGHGGVKAFGDVSDFSLINVKEAEAACRKRIVDYVALGDTHSAMKLGDDGTVYYSGAPEVTDFLEPTGGGENNSGKALIVHIEVSDDTAPAQVTVEEITVGKWEFVALEADINDFRDAEAFVSMVREKNNKRNSVVKYALAGTVDLHTYAWLEEQLEALAPGFARLYPRERLMNLHVMPGEEDLARMGDGGGYINIAVQELLERARAEDPAARDALGLLYRLHNGQHTA